MFGTVMTRELTAPVSVTVTDSSCPPAAKTLPRREEETPGYNAAMEPLIVCLWIVAAAFACTWILSVVTGEHSWVDRIWSIMPVVYVWVFAFAAGLADVRLTLVACLVTLWGARLTFNFARKGGYAPGGEDYRWVALRSRMTRGQFAAFNLLFISLYQNVVIFLITLPAVTLYLNPGPLTGLDAVATLVFLVLLAGETVADQQQWNFQKWKAAESAQEREPSPRFLQRGLFRVSRHPNFFFEIAQWWVVFAFGAIAAGSPWQWTALGAVLLTVLFAASTAFTERISRSRYPEYADYQASTSAVVPWFPLRRP
jgi:steroid 5-alpha reductase family enzyme